MKKKFRNNHVFKTYMYVMTEQGQMNTYSTSQYLEKKMKKLPFPKQEIALKESSSVNQKKIKHIVSAQNNV